MSDDMIIEVGQVWESCDPREYSRRVMIIGEGIDSVFCKNIETGRRSTIRRSRFHEDSRGYRFVSPGLEGG